jgi:hypothetical protein
VQELLKEIRLRNTSALETVHWSAIHNQTSPELDRETIRGRGDFAAELVEKSDALLGGDEAQKSFVAAAWQHQKALQLSKWIPEPDSCERAAIIRQAERRALDMVLERMEQEAER